MKKEKSSAEIKPDYVLAMEEAYGAPSQEAFGSAVFFERVEADDDLEELAKKYYQYFVGELWERWGEETWMTPWKAVYQREEDTTPDIVQELQKVNDRDALSSVTMILSVPSGGEALAGAYDAPQVADMRVFNTGDGSAMYGLLLAGRRENGEATFLAFLYD